MNKIANKHKTFTIFLACGWLSTMFLAVFTPVSLRPVFADQTTTTDQNNYVDKYFEIDNDGHWKMNVYLGDQKISTVDDTGTTTFPLADHLGSPVTITNQNGKIVENNEYDAFGNIIYSTSTVKNMDKFTGKQLDSETNLQYYGARYLDNVMGRFNSVDPALFKLNDDQAFQKIYQTSLQTHLSNPQNLNSYSYVTNNPTKLVDKNGENPVIFAIGVAVSSLFWGIPVAQSPGNDYNFDTINTNETIDFIGSVFSPYNNFNTAEKLLVMGVMGGVINKGSSEFVSKFATNKSQIDRIVVSAEGAYGNAVSGYGYSKFLQRYLGEGKKQLEKSYNSFQKVIEEHIDKLSNPGKYLDINSMTGQEMLGVVNKWKGDLFRNTSYQNIIKNILNNK